MRPRMYLTTQELLDAYQHTSPSCLQNGTGPAPLRPPEALEEQARQVSSLGG